VTHLSIRSVALVSTVTRHAGEAVRRSNAAGLKLPTTPSVVALSVEWCACGLPGGGVWPGRRLGPAEACTGNCHMCRGRPWRWPCLWRLSPCPGMRLASGIPMPHGAGTMGRLNPPPPRQSERHFVVLYTALAFLSTIVSSNDRGAACGTHEQLVRGASGKWSPDLESATPVHGPATWSRLWVTL